MMSQRAKRLEDWMCKLRDRKGKLLGSSSHSQHSGKQKKSIVGAVELAKVETPAVVPSYHTSSLDRKIMKINRNLTEAGIAITKSVKRANNPTSVDNKPFFHTPQLERRFIGPWLRTDQSESVRNRRANFNFEKKDRIYENTSLNTSPLSMFTGDANFVGPSERSAFSPLQALQFKSPSYQDLDALRTEHPVNRTQKARPLDVANYDFAQSYIAASRANDAAVPFNGLSPNATGRQTVELATVKHIPLIMQHSLSSSKPEVRVSATSLSNNQTHSHSDYSSLNTNERSSSLTRDALISHSHSSSASMNKRNSGGSSTSDYDFLVHPDTHDVDLREFAKKQRQVFRDRRHEAELMEFNENQKQYLEDQERLWKQQIITMQEFINRSEERQKKLVSQIERLLNEREQLLRTVERCRGQAPAKTQDDGWV